MFETPWGDAFIKLVLRVAHHGVGFSRARLAIGKDSAIVAL